MGWCGVGWLDRLRDKKGATPGGAGTPAAGDPAPRRDDGPSDRASEVRAVEVHRATLPFGEALVTPRGQATSLVLDAVDAELLRGAWPHRPLAVHARALAERAGVGAEEAAARLEALQQRGLLATRAQVHAALVAAPLPDAPALITTIGVVTKDRPELLARALESHRAVAQAQGRTVELAVYDDSVHPELRALGARYAGREEKRAYLDRLAARVPEVPRAVLAFGLGLDEPSRLGTSAGTAAGANRNVALLDVAGTCALSVDDDTTARVALGAGLDGPAGLGAAAGLVLTSAHDATTFRFHADRAGALGTAPWADVDPLALHERLLGRAVGALVAALPAEAVDLDTASAPLLRRLGAQGGRVRLTSLGLVGDSGMGSPAYYVLLGEPTRSRLFADYPAFRRTRAVLRQVDRPTVSAGTFLMGPSVGLDAREVLPPFLPYGRNQDGAYAVALRTLAPDGYLGHLPAAVEHAPADERRFGEGPSGGVALLADVVIHALEGAPLASVAGAEARYARVGAHLIGLGALPPRELAELTVVERAGRVASQIGRLQAALDGPPPGAPAAWVADVEAQVEHLRAAAVDPALALPSGWVKAHGLEGAARQLGEVLTLYGRLVEAWPAVFAAARALRDEGGRPAA